MKGQLRIDHLYAFIVLDSDGTEGVPAMFMPPNEAIPGFHLLPLMGADMTRIDQLRQFVKSDPMLKGKKITLAKFTHREELEVIQR